MVVTRSQDKSGRSAEPAKPSNKQSNQAKTGGTKRKSKDEGGEETILKAKTDSHTPKKQRHGKATESASTNGADKSLRSKVDKVLAKYGEPPLKGLISEKKLPAGQIVLAHIFNALLSSTRISHNIATRSLSCLLDKKYHDIQVLHKTTWQERTEVLTAGGYVHYREKTATYLGELAELIKDKYDDDPSKILTSLPKESESGKVKKELSSRLEEIKGLGPMGVDIFLGSIQGFYANITPFLDTRSRKTAKTIGLGDDLDALYAAVGKDAARMAELEVALTTVRLEKLESEFTQPDGGSG